MVGVHGACMARAWRVLCGGVAVRTALKPSVSSRYLYRACSVMGRLVPLGSSALP